ncbi:protein ABHD17C [Ditylenchus destructor]|nr:protein ABHD17C [Ditylenchus destructor]
MSLVNLSEEQLSTREDELPLLAYPQNTADSAQSVKRESSKSRRNRRKTETSESSKRNILQSWRTSRQPTAASGQQSSDNQQSFNCFQCCFYAVICCAVGCWLACPPVPSCVARKLAFHPPRRGKTYGLSFKDVDGEMIEVDSAREAYRKEEIRIIPRKNAIRLAEALINSYVFIVKTAKKNHLACVWLSSNAPSGNNVILLMAQPNSSDLGDLVTFRIISDNMGVDAVLFDYSGYGMSSGRATEANIYADIEAVYKFIRQRNSSAQAVPRSGCGVIASFAQRVKGFQMSNHSAGSRKFPLPPIDEFPPDFAENELMQYRGQLSLSFIKKQQNRHPVYQNKQWSEVLDKLFAFRSRDGQLTVTEPDQNIRRNSNFATVYDYLYSYLRVVCSPSGIYAIVMVQAALLLHLKVYVAQPDLRKGNLGRKILKLHAYNHRLSLTENEAFALIPRFKMEQVSPHSLHNIVEVINIVEDINQLPDFNTSSQDTHWVRKDDEFLLDELFDTNADKTLVTFKFVDWNRQNRKINGADNEVEWLLYDIFYKRSERNVGQNHIQVYDIDIAWVAIKLLLNIYFTNARRYMQKFRDNCFFYDECSDASLLGTTQRFKTKRMISMAEKIVRYYNIYGTLKKQKKKSTSLIGKPVREKVMTRIIREIYHKNVYVPVEAKVKRPHYSPYNRPIGYGSYGVKHNAYSFGSVDDW